MAQKKTTVKVEDRDGNEVEVPVGIDGVNPVSPNNPPAKAVAEADREVAVEAREAEVEAAEAQAEAAGAGAKAASTNKEDNSPGNRNAASNPNQKSQAQSAADAKK